MKSLAGYSIAAFAGAAMLAMTLSPASAFTLSGPSLEQPVASAQIDKVWWRGGGWGWRGGWGYRAWSWRRPVWGWTGYAYYPGYCWRGYYGFLHCN
jgi:hypothetical protein